MWRRRIILLLLISIVLLFVPASSKFKTFIPSFSQQLQLLYIQFVNSISRTMYPFLVYSSALVKMIAERNRVILWSLSLLYIFSLFVIWLLCTYEQFDESAQFCFFCFHHALGIGFMVHCLWSKKSHMQKFDGLKNEVHKRLTMIGGLGQLIWSVYFFYSLIAKSPIHYIVIILKLLYIILQIMNFILPDKISVPKSKFVSIFGVAHLLYVNASNFLSDWLSNKAFEAFGTTDPATPNEFKTTKLMGLCLFTAMQHSLWCAFAFLTIWETMWRRKSTTTELNKVMTFDEEK